MDLVDMFEETFFSTKQRRLDLQMTSEAHKDE